MRIAIMAAGGVGGYFGARLAAAGHDVHFLARGAHLKAIREGGLRVESENGDLHLKDAQATDDPAAIGPVDAVLFAVKLWDTDTAAEALNPLLGPDTFVVPFQNGVGAMDALTRHIGAARTAGGVAHISAVIGAPGLIKHTGKVARLTIGERDGSVTPRMEKLKAAFEDGGFDHAVSTNIVRAQWDKFIFLSTLSGLTALCRQPVGPIREDPDSRPLLEAAIAETTAVGRAEGVALGDGTEAKIMGHMDGLLPEIKASMLHDLEAGRRLELPWLSGEVVRLGKKHGIATPVHATVLGALKFYVNGK